jgi:superfamily II DNA or RNA helicase
MSASDGDRVFYCGYDLKIARRVHAKKEPASHQSAALAHLDKWYDSRPFPEAGGILVLPTGGGKTFTAIRFLCRQALSSGYKVLWLAHTHHLLEQAYCSFDDGVSQIAEPRVTLNVRVVSGTIGHYPVHKIKETDDVIVGTLQTLGRALSLNHPELECFLKAAGKKLFVVFDEAHHSPAPSYRNLVFNLRNRFPEMYLLGLTATPTYSDESKRGWLKKVFPQGIVHEIKPQSLMAAGVLARPILEEPRTLYTPDFDEREYQKWLGTHRDLPEDVITQLAHNRDRNLFIADQYVSNKDRYGKTLVFADRWYQCEQISEFLRGRGIRTGTVYSHIDADPGSAEARNRRKSDENAIALQKFRDGELDVLLNVRMLTEGTDVPDVKSVFLTRGTTSQILLTQMVGRALRGPKFGGTDEAYIVSFVDNWKHLINWAGYDQLAEGMADESIPEYGKRPPLQLISIELVQRLARQMDSGINMTPSPYVLLLPVGWYRVNYQAQVESSDDLEPVRELVMVFEGESGCYRKFADHIAKEPLEAFAAENLQLTDVENHVVQWADLFFPEQQEHFGTNLLEDLFRIARHTAQNGAVPRFFPFEERDSHNLDDLAKKLVPRKMSDLDKDDALAKEYHRNDRLWSSIYYHYDLFKSQYDACVNRLLHAIRHGSDPQDHKPKRVQIPPGERLVGTEPSEEIKLQVKRRDHFRCLCCGSVSKRGLQVDHIHAHYYGGGNPLDNLQTLCSNCNIAKGVSRFNFRTHRTTLSETLKTFQPPKPPSGHLAEDLDLWGRFVTRSVNLYFQCAAVDSVEIGKRGERFYDWRIKLNHGNDPRWIRPLTENILLLARRERGKVGRGVPETITISSPDLKVITVKSIKAT